MDSHSLVLMPVPVPCVVGGDLFASSPELIYTLGTNRNVTACAHLWKL